MCQPCELKETTMMHHNTAFPSVLFLEALPIKLESLSWTHSAKNCNHDANYSGWDMLWRGLMCWKQSIYPGWTLGWSAFSELMHSSWKATMTHSSSYSTPLSYLIHGFKSNTTHQVESSHAQLVFLFMHAGGITDRKIIRSWLWWMTVLLSFIPSDILNGSAVCVYRMEDVVRAFKGDFLHKEGPQYKWAEFTGKVPYPRPGTVS